MTAGTYTTQAREIIEGERPIGAQLRSPEERRDLAREALLRRGFTPVAQPDGSIRYVQTFTQKSFAWLTPLSGGAPIAVNPRYVETVETVRGHEDTTYTMLTMESGEPIMVKESAAEAVQKLEAVAQLEAVGEPEAAAA